jgi:coenzyme F420-reducing hydrogenase delta subunit
MADACAGCGICVAECPRGAIRLTALENTLAAEAAARAPAASARATIFCCARSADPARALAGEIDKDLAVDATVVRVPCAGAVAVGHILAAFAGGAAGVLVLSCHTDNCYSETGNRHARRRVENLAERLERMGVGGGRLATATLAANMPVEYAEITRRFIQKIHHLQTQR